MLCRGPWLSSISYYAWELGVFLRGGKTSILPYTMISPLVALTTFSVKFGVEFSVKNMPN